MGIEIEYKTYIYLHSMNNGDVPRLFASVYLQKLTENELFKVGKSEIDTHIENNPLICEILCYTIYKHRYAIS